MPHAWTVIWSGSLLAALLFLNVIAVGWPFSVQGPVSGDLLIEKLVADIAIGLGLLGLSTYQVGKLCRAGDSRFQLTDGLALLLTSLASLAAYRIFVRSDPLQLAMMIPFSLACAAIVFSWFGLMRILAKTKLRADEPDLDENVELNSKPVMTIGWLALVLLAYLGAAFTSLCSAEVIGAVNDLNCGWPFGWFGGEFGLDIRLVFFVRQNRPMTWDPILLTANLILWSLATIGALRVTYLIARAVNRRLRLSGMLAATGAFASMFPLARYAVGHRGPNGAWWKTRAFHDLLMAGSIIVFVVGIGAAQAVAFRWAKVFVTRSRKSAASSSVSLRWLLRAAICITLLVVFWWGVYGVYRHAVPSPPLARKLWWRGSEIEFGDAMGMSVRRDQEIRSALVHKLSDPAHLSHRSLSELQYLEFRDQSLSDLSALDGRNIRVLVISWTKVSDLRPLRRYINLRRLSAAGTEVRDVSVLTSCPRLTELELTSSKVDDLAPLSKLENLRSLGLDATDVKDLSPLMGLKKLRLLSIVGVRIDDEQVKQLRAALPKCKIVK